MGVHTSLIPATASELQHLMEHPKELLDFIWTTDVEAAPYAFLEKSVRDWQAIFDAIPVEADLEPSRIPENRLIRYYPSRYCFYYALLPNDIRHLRDAVSAVTVDALAARDLSERAVYALQFRESLCGFVEYAAARNLGAIMTHG